MRHVFDADPDGLCLRSISGVPAAGIRGLIVEPWFELFNRDLIHFTIHEKVLVWKALGGEGRAP